MYRVGYVIVITWVPGFYGLFAPMSILYPAIAS